jgi:Zn-dependent M28 family amino/carboxypeptidase
MPPQPVEVVNVLAVLPGSNPTAATRRYYMTGHYDSRASLVNDGTTPAPGANDNAASIGAMLEIARVMSTRHFDSTIAFLAVAGEEQALLGSRLHAQADKQAGIQVAGVVNNDIIGDPSSPHGAPINHQVRIFSEGIPQAATALADFTTVRSQASENDSNSRNLARYAGEVARWQGTQLKPILETKVDRMRRSSDHIGFNEMGFTAIRITTVDETFERQHQTPRVEDGVTYGDTPEFVDQRFAAKVARLDAAIITHMASAPLPPANPTLYGEYVTNVRLSWTATADPSVGYEVLWRPTESQEWQALQDMGTGTTATMMMNKDNVFFGVRSYNSAGFRSPVVTFNRLDCTLVAVGMGPTSVCAP